MTLAGLNSALRMYYTSNFFPTIDLFPISVWNPYQACSSSDCLCNISSLLLFQAMVGSGKLARSGLKVLKEVNPILLG